MSQQFNGISKEYVCPVCQKKFYVPFGTRMGCKSRWVFKRRKKNKTLNLCSYSCTRQYDEEQEHEVTLKKAMI